MGMSSDILRNGVITSWPLLTPQIPFVDTINIPFPPEQPLPDLWGTAMFETSSRRHVTMGTNPWVEETGVCTLVYLSPSGQGEDLAVSAASQAMLAWDLWIDSTAAAWFTSVGAPRQMTVEVLGVWFLIGLACEYRVQERLNP